MDTVNLTSKIKTKLGVTVPIFVTALVALPVYLWLAWFFLVPGALWSPDEGAKLLQIMNLDLEGPRLSYNIAYSGQDFDPELRFFQPQLTHGLLSVREGSLYFLRIPIFPLLVKPFFYFFGVYGLYLLPILGGMVTIAYTLKLNRQNKNNFLIWVIIAIGSPLLIYAIIFWEHTLATGIALLAVWLAISTGPIDRNAARSKKLRWLLAGFLLGASIYLRLENILFALGFLISYSIVYSEKRWGPIWVGILILLIFLPYLPIHWLMFNQGFPENARYLFYPFYYLNHAGWRVIPDLLVGPNLEGEFDPGLAGYLWALLVVGVIICSIIYRKSGKIFFIQQFCLWLSTLIAAYFLLTPVHYRSAHGLIFTTPWVLLGLSKAPEILRRGDRNIKLLTLACVLGLMGYGIAILGLRASSPQGGLEWGARFAFSFFPILAIMTVWEPTSRIRSINHSLLLVTMILLGVGFQARGILVLRHDKQINAEINHRLLKSVEENVVSDLWWLPFNAAPIYYQKAFFVFPDAETISEWVDIAAEKKIKQFSLVTVDSDLPEEITQYVEKSRLGIAGIDKVENVLIYHIIVEPNF